MNIRTDELKDENYIPLGINAGGIINQIFSKALSATTDAHSVFDKYLPFLPCLFLTEKKYTVIEHTQQKL